MPYPPTQTLYIIKKTPRDHSEAIHHQWLLQDEASWGPRPEAALYRYEAACSLARRLLHASTEYVFHIESVTMNKETIDGRSIRPLR
jgi:hypothetical protein